MKASAQWNPPVTPERPATVAGRRLFLAIMLLLAAMGAGPAGAQPPAWQDVARESETRTGLAPAWPGGETAPMNAPLLADGLTEAEAAQLALANNAELHAAFGELGIAQADVMAAGLYTNPSLEVLLRFPQGGGSSNVETELGFSLADLWLVPARKRVARARAEQLTMEVVSEVLNTVADAKRAHNACVIAVAKREQAAQVLAAAEAWRAQMRLRADFGFHSQWDLSMADAFVARQALMLEEADAGVAIAYARLRHVTGVATEELQAQGELPTPPDEPVVVADLVALALAHRPDVRAARLGLVAADRAITLARRSVWRDVTVGPAFARETDGTDLWGGLLQVGLPVFDRNQAGRARAEAERRQAGNQAEATVAAAREQVTIAAASLTLALARERLLRERILPARQAALDFATRYYNEMQLNMLFVLQARQELYAAQMEHTAALGAIREAQIELEFAVGGQRPRGAHAAH
jgi:cobalt-zinc-cadmium efflux system outer membrane protein